MLFFFFLHMLFITANLTNMYTASPVCQALLCVFYFIIIIFKGDFLSFIKIYFI